MDSLALLDRTGRDAPDGGRVDHDLLERLGPRKPPRIRCPKCTYVPARADTWMCWPQCGRQWNTFDTRGVCPACHYQWRETACPRCAQWSLHEDWYEPSPDQP